MESGEQHTETVFRRLELLIADLDRGRGHRNAALGRIGEPPLPLGRHRALTHVARGGRLGSELLLNLIDRAFGPIGIGTDDLELQAHFLAVGQEDGAVNTIRLSLDEV
ncbi:hypothetical protein D9M70_368590 [compost metagenome]